MTRYAVPLDALGDLWQTPAGAALVESAVQPDAEDAKTVTIRGDDCVVLEGPAPRIAAIVAALHDQSVAVYEGGGNEWSRVTTPPEVPALPDEDATFEDERSPRIDREFAQLCGMLSPDERERLKASIQQHGCRDPLVVWADRDVLVDGHNRLSICRELGIDFDVVEYEFEDREAVVRWIADNALARRNLTRPQRDYLVGKRYVAERKAHGGDRGASGQSDHMPRTAEKVAATSGLSEKTVRRAAEYAQAVDRIAECAGTKARAAILSGDVRLTRRQVLRAAEQGVGSLDDLRALKSDASPRDVLADFLAAAARAARLGEQAIRAGLVPDIEASVAAFREALVGARGAPCGEPAHG